jgi:hypothetical protein
MIKEQENTLLTEQEAADFFGWSVYTMREIRKRGEIEFLRFHDRTIRYMLQQLEDYKCRHMSHVIAAQEGADDER